MRTIIIFLLMTIQMQKEDEQKEVVFGGGCFWCTEAIFKQLKGVIEVSSGYAGGSLKNPGYNDVCTGETGHAEVIRIKYNPNEIGFEKLLEVFFFTHDPTTLNRQVADVGLQYRSVVFFTTSEQKKITHEIIANLNESKVFENQIVTEVLPLDTFFLAERNHQNYFNLNKKQPYCQYVIQPKMDKFRKKFDVLIKK